MHMPKNKEQFSHLDNFFTINFHEQMKIPFEVLWIFSPFEQAHQIHCQTYTVAQQSQQLKDDLAVKNSQSKTIQTDLRIAMFYHPPQWLTFSHPIWSDMTTVDN